MNSFDYYKKRTVHNKIYETDIVKAIVKKFYRWGYKHEDNFVLFEYVVSMYCGGTVFRSLIDYATMINNNANRNDRQVKTMIDCILDVFYNKVNPTVFTSHLGRFINSCIMSNTNLDVKSNPHEYNEFSGGSKIVASEVSRIKKKDIQDFIVRRERALAYPDRVRAGSYLNLILNDLFPDD